MEIKVYETRKYSVFKKLEGNRDLCSVKKIVDSINKVGYIPSPVCVNENMEVIDGQNRIEALKQLGMPVHYYIVNGVGLEEARQMNIGRKNWQLIDYFKSFAAEGKEEYVYFLKMLEKHNRYRLLELWSIYYGATNGRGNRYQIIVPESKVNEDLGAYVGKEIILGVRPESIHDEEMYLSNASTGVIDANVEITEMMGAETYLYLLCEGIPLTARVSPRSTARPGDDIKVAIDPNRIHIFDKETEKAIVN